MKKDELEFLSELTQVTAQMHLEQIDDPEHLKAYKNVIEFRNNLSSETDRGLVLMAVAYIDERLSVLLEKYFVDDKGIIKTLFDATGPLGSFSSKLKLAYGIGLLPKNIYIDCNKIRKIRNSFAHVSKPMTFEDEPIKSQTHSLIIHGIDNHNRVKVRFTRSVMSILLEIEDSIRTITKCEPKKDFNVKMNQNAMLQIRNFLKEKGFCHTDDL
jgi:DNA-binding MltR family transcriptional regulator